MELAPSSPLLPSGSPRTSLAPYKTFEDVYPKGVVLNENVISLMDQRRIRREAISFDDITLEDKPSDFHPNDIILHTFVTRKISLKGCGIISAAMDTVTEQEMALAMAKMGGMGIIHRNLEAEEQAAMVEWVRKKIHNDGMIDSPKVFAPKNRYATMQKIIRQRGWTFTSFPIVDDNNKLVGMITKDEMGFVDPKSNPLLSEMMIPRTDIVTSLEGTNTEAAYRMMLEKRVKKLPVVDTQDHLVGMYVWSDVRNDQVKKERFSLDEEGHFLVGAAIGLGKEDFTRAELLIKHGCRVLVMDSSHGACKPAKEQLKAIKEKYGDKVEIIVGNIASYDAAKYLLEGPIESRPDALKVGIGPGSICTTRQVTGHGIPQVTAIYEVWRAIQDFGKETGYYIPIIADGGIKCSGDIVKCLASGASSVMLGSMLAATTESPGIIINKGGKRYKTIRGMGSRAAMEERSGSRGRYLRQSNAHTTEELTNAQAQKMVPEGVEGLVEFQGGAEKVMTALLGGVQAGLAHSGAQDIPTFQRRATIWAQGFAGVIEGKPHDIHDIRH